MLELFGTEKKNWQLQWVVANMYVILKQKWVPTMIYKMFNTRILTTYHFLPQLLPLNPSGRDVSRSFYV